MGVSTKGKKGTPARKGPSQTRASVGEKEATVTLRRDQWPTVLFALEALATQKDIEWRKLAAVEVRRVRAEVVRQSGVGT